jgi:nucleoside-diphosphate-sugar epimerase
VRIAVLGATSQIAKDLILSFSAQESYDLTLYARRPDVVRNWLTEVRLDDRYTASDFAGFKFNEHFDAILNFVGVGNPAQAAAMGASILDITLQYDELALGYLREYPNCRYIFLSSGAAYGSAFDGMAAIENTKATVAINDLQPQDYYGVAKLHAECRHRSLRGLKIIDIRVFNYFSHTQDMSARFLITDIVRSIQRNEVLITSPENIVRDYIGPDDFSQLVSRILVAPPANDVIDCYTKAPLDKMTLLSTMKEQFGLEYQVKEIPIGINATGLKTNYFSNNRRASAWGYEPILTSLETIIRELRRRNL